jgi:hypothetical protein
MEKSMMMSLGRNGSWRVAESASVGGSRDWLGGGLLWLWILVWNGSRGETKESEILDELRVGAVNLKDVVLKME